MLIYADNAATTAMSKAAIDSMLDSMQHVYGNPSSFHTPGQEAQKALGQARESVAKLLHAHPSEIYFTSGGTEADNWAIMGAAALGKKKNKTHIITSAFEHHAVLHTTQALEKQGFEVTYLDVHEDGIVRVDELKAAMRTDTALVSIMYANNEIGTVQPIAQIGELCRERGVLFHTDAVQAVGHISVDVVADKVDMLSFSGHKFSGPKGVGGLYVRKGIALPQLMYGGAQERSKRPGTENLPAIVGMVTALQEAIKNLDENIAYISALRDKLTKGFEPIVYSRQNGHASKRLPGIVNFSFEGIEGEAMLLLLDMVGISASSGSACTSGSLDPSHVLLAMGLRHEVAHGSLRLSLNENNTKEEMDYIIEKLPPIIERLREMSPLWERMQKGEAI